MKKLYKIIGFSIFVLSLISTFFFYIFFKKNIIKQNQRLNLGEDISYTTLFDKIDESNFISNIETLKIAASVYRIKNRKIKKGSYLINRNLSNVEFLEKITRGEQDPINLIIGQFDTKEELTEYLSKHLMVKGTDILALLNDNEFLSKYNLKKETSLTLFIPNSYQLYWTISAKQFIERIFSEYKNFWNIYRINKAKKINLTITNIIILASIVEKEIVIPEEASIIAGVFINRLNKKMRLQSDPTTFYAAKYDLNITEKISSMRAVKSKYNTYRYAGLPIGPICMPSIKTIDAVLNYKKHDFLFFVTSRDRQHHLFSKTFSEHSKNIKYTFRKVKK